MLKAVLSTAFFTALLSVSAAGVAASVLNCTKDHEIFIGCPGCERLKCSNIGLSIRCYAPKACVGECGCEEGYLKNDQGDCILKDDCPSCGGDPNAVLSECGRKYNIACANYKNKTDCPAFCEYNKCECRKGFIYDDQLNKCVRPEDYNSTCICGPNEEHSECANGGCFPRNCSQAGSPKYCPKIDPNDCVEGCICIEGYLRDKSGHCIPEDECPDICGTNEVFSECANGGCFPRNCSQAGKLKYCPKIDPADCLEGCICKEGYLRDRQGKCIPEKECPCPCGPNEEFSECANSGCFPRDCAHVKSPKYCPKVDPADCKEGCICKEGYYRDKRGNCILKKDCPGICGSNEIFSECANGGCFPRNCSQAGKPKYCPKIDPADCLEGCICKEGYLRDRQGKCIPEKECPCPCGPNEEFSECANSGCFPRDCAHVKSPKYCPKVDPAGCKEGCICKEGYYRDKRGNCILKKDCPGICGTNEVLSECANGGCFPRNCSQADQPKYCIKINAADCKEGCVCLQGYLRNEVGKCVPENECCTANNPANCSEALERLLRGNVQFTGNFLNDWVKTDSKKSAIMSPFSVLIPLANLALYTDIGESYNQLMSILNLKNKEEIRCVFPQLIKSYQAQNDSALLLATKVYVSINEKLTDQYKADSQAVFDAEGESIDFSDPQNAADEINNWVASKTNNLIKDLVSPAMFTSFTRFVLTNAIYFLGSWVDQFNPAATFDRDFYVTPNNVIQTKTMNRKGTYKFANIPSLDATVVEIPYKGNTISYVAFLPNSLDGLVNLVDKLKDPAVLNDALDQLSPQTVDVLLPRYETATSIDLATVLQNLSITDLFDASKSDLNGILESLDKLSVTDAVHKANIKVDEVGTEAAAANALVVGATSSSEVFNADHPFVYYIFLGRSPLFAGFMTGVN